MSNTTKWEHLGEAGPHENHRLHADAMSDVWCVECAEWLTDDEADEAWPMDDGGHHDNTQYGG